MSIKPEEMDPIDVVHQALQKYIGLKLMEVNKTSSWRAGNPLDEIQLIFEGGLEMLINYNGFMDVD